MKSRTLAFLAVATLSILAAPSAQAVPTLTFTNPSTDTSAAIAAEAAFLAGLSAGSITETFEGYTAGRTPTYDPLTTSPVGTFDQILMGSTGGACNLVNGCVGLAILSNAPGVSPFSGRFAAPPGAGNSNWLDSNDSREMKFTLTPGFRAVGFYLTDPNDAGGQMTITGTDGTTTSFTFDNIFGDSIDDGDSGYVSYLTIVDPTGIKDITFLSGAPGDGYGIDTVTIGNPVPEPGTLLLVGGGVLALALRGRRKRG
jgi:hypothetical protein